MTFQELETKVSQYTYNEDSGLARIALASIIATRMKLGNPIWLVIIGQSSGGKSQILRPLAMTDSKFIHRVDDLTENTLLSGAKVVEGAGQVSLLKKIGEHGIIVVSDFTVIFSKGSEARSAILSQFRMIYDGEMTKMVGNSTKPITWHGEIGVLAGSTPSIYAHFEEVADMGERFIYYRMKKYDVEKATRLSLGRKLYGRELDMKLSTAYSDYIGDCVKSFRDESLVAISDSVNERILNIALFASKLRTPAHYDKYTKQIDRIPVPEAPMRVALQLSSLAKGLMIMAFNDTGVQELGEQDIQYIEYCAYSLSNEERRACLRVLCGVSFETMINTATVADLIGLSTEVAGQHLQHLVAIGILERGVTSYAGNALAWKFKRQEEWAIVRRMEGVVDTLVQLNMRDLTAEEMTVQNKEAEEIIGDNW